VAHSTLHLLRHGETEGGPRYRGSSDDALTPLGWQQMETAVGDTTWDRIITSPLIRCADFARALAERRSIPLTIDPRLREMHFGAWEGKSAAELMESDADALARFWRDPAANPPPGGEPLADFQARMLGAWREIIQNHPGQRLLLVSHGGPIRAILCEVQGHPLTRMLEIEVGHGALRCVRVGDGFPELREDDIP